jgi:hypothetical protein
MSLTKRTMAEYIKAVTTGDEILRCHCENGGIVQLIVGYKDSPSLLTR